MFSLGPLQIFISETSAWFRLLGYGLQVLNNAAHPPLFSERNGYRRRLKIGAFRIGILMPHKA